MAVTASTDIAAWIPDVISASIYDTMYEADFTLNALAARYGELEGRPGDSITIPTDGIVAPADDLAETVAAVDDKLAGAGVTMTVKEAVKSIAWYDRTKIQSGRDLNQVAGRRVGGAITERIEIDLGAALLAGRDTTKDPTATVASYNLAAVTAQKAKIPAKLRRRGVVAVGTDASLSGLLSDTTVQNAAAFGSDEAIREGAFSRPLFGVTPIAVDDNILPATVTAGAVTGKPVVMFARGMLVRAFQKMPSSEVERDARARLTRIVGTAFHGEGVVDSRGVVLSLVA